MAYINNGENFLLALKGDSAFIRYSAHADGTDFTVQWSDSQDYIGFATGQSAPTDKEGYTWIPLNALRAQLAAENAERAAAGAQDIIDNLEVVQTTGNSKKAIMSQAASTACYNKNAKRITNLEQGIVPEPFETDDSVAYYKSVPSNALPYAEIQHFGGITRKCSNLAPEDARDVVDFNTIYYVTVGNNFKEHVGEEVTVSFDIKLKTLNAVTNHMAVYAYQESGYSLAENKTFFPTTEWARYSFTTSIKKYDGTHNEGIIAFYDGNTSANGAQNVYSIRNIQINLGNTANSFEPYFEGFRTSKVTEIESVGVNIIPFPYQHENTVTLKGVTFTINSDRSITANGTATDVVYYNIADVYYVAGNYYTLSGAPAGVAEVGYLYDDIQKMYDYGAGVTKGFENTSKGKIYICIKRGAVASNLTFRPMLHKGNDALPYKPYTKHTLPIPAEVQALDGYGYSVRNNLFNYIDWEKQLFVERVGCVNIGTLEWIYDSTNEVFTATLRDMKPDSQGLLCEKYELSPIADSVKAPDKTIYGRSVKDLTTGIPVGSIGVKDSTHTDATIDTAFNDIMLYYELAEPRYTDISHLITADNFIAVEGGGTIIADNDYLYSVPTVITYMLKEETV